MSNALFEKVLASPSLPSLPAVAVEVLRVTRDPQAKLIDIARIVQNDPGLSAKILKTVNSSLYGLKERCTRIDRALGFMGMNAVKSIVLGISLVDGTKGVKSEAGFDANQFWKKTIYGAAAARHLAQITASCDPDEAFTAGLFQDIGILASVIALRDEYIEVFNAAADPALLADTETEQLGFDHTQVGGELSSRWSLPGQYIDCIRHHHSAHAYNGAYADMVRIVTLGGFLADSCGGQLASKQLSRFRLSADKWFPGLLDNPEALLNATIAAAKELAKLFEKSVGAAPDTEAIMAEFQERSFEHQMAMQQEADKLRQSNEALAAENYTDPLTRIGNRRRFDSETAQAITAADEASPRGELSLLFVDADKFKSVNDTYGHPAGDAVLIELARRISTEVGQAGLACRFGGEEFAVLLRGCDGTAAAMMGERVRACVAATPFDTSHVQGAPAELKVTISVGVATRQLAGQGPLAGASIEKLLTAADEAVYAAKQGGRNCVRVAGADRRAPAADAVAASVVAPATPGRAVRVMVVEDDPLAAALLRACLQRQPGIEVVIVESSDEALNRITQDSAAKRAPHIVLCDQHTDGIPGHEFVRNLRNNPAASSIPVIITTAKATNEITRLATEAGARAVVSKSELARDLSRWVVRIITEAATPSATRAAA